MKYWEWEQLCQTIKSILKSKKIKYADLATEVGLSEASIKRILSGDDIKLKKLMDICEVLQINFFELTELSKKSKEKTFILTLEQEKFFAENLKYYAYFSLLLFDHMSPDEILEKYKILPKTANQILAKLEKFNLLKRMNDGKVKMLVHGQLNWHSNGPLGSTIGKNSMFKVLEHADQNTETALLTYSERKVTPETAKILMHEAKQLAKSFREKAQFDESIYTSKDLIDISWVFCVAPIPSLVDRIIKDNPF